MAHKHTKELSYLLEQLVLVYGYDELVAVAGTNSQVSQLNSGGRRRYGDGGDTAGGVATAGDRYQVVPARKLKDDIQI